MNDYLDEFEQNMRLVAQQEIARARRNPFGKFRRTLMFEKFKEYFLDHQVAIYALLTVLALVLVLIVLL